MLEGAWVFDVIYWVVEIVGIVETMGVVGI